MLPSAPSILAGFLLRMIQVGLESSLYLVIGFAMTGLLRAMVGPERLRRHFGSGRLTAPLRAWATAATMLPVCALGVLPVAYELRRSGVARHAIVTLMLTAPMLNPITLLYGLSYLGLSFMLVLVAGTFLVAVGAGVCLGPGRTEDPESIDPALPNEGRVKLLAGAAHAVSVARGPVWREIALGVVGASVLASLMPESYLAEHMFARDPLAIPRMAVIAPASYVTPENAMTMIPEVMKFDQSMGAMFLILALGAGMTLGHVGFLVQTLRPSTVARWFSAALLIALASAYAVQGVSSRVGTENQDNDHFGELANPFAPHGGFGSFGHEITAAATLAGPVRWVAVVVVLGLAITGERIRRRGDGASFESILRSAAPVEAAVPVVGRRIWDEAMPKPVAGAMLGILALFVAMLAAFAYFPSPFEVFQDMRVIKADVYSEMGAKSSAVPLHHLELWDRQAAKLPTGALIRLSGPSDEARKLTAELRLRIAAVREAIETGNESEARARFLDIQDVYASCEQAYRIP